MKGSWVERCFDDFRDGIFNNGGQNLYVSKAGVLQRIFRFDVNNDGYADLLFANSHDYVERASAGVIQQSLWEKDGSGAQNGWRLCR